MTSPHDDDAGEGEHDVLALIDHYQIERQAAEDELAALRTQVQELTAERDKMLSQLSTWTHEYGSALCPGGSADSFGDGMREAKRQIALILSGFSSDARDIRARKNTPSPQEGDKETSSPPNIAHVDKDGLRCASTCGLTGDG